ncbi:unnamed protein product [Amoebophrya sp. A120]|nr:unnamed protein product [Amoebophrya sp. A120]|eukprot:GSA120T00015746001.1
MLRAALVVARHLHTIRRCGVKYGKASPVGNPNSVLTLATN